VRERED
jgi:hypothetical protein